MCAFVSDSDFHLRQKDIRVYRHQGLIEVSLIPDGPVQTATTLLGRPSRLVAQCQLGRGASHRR